jgi:hypothetical protein
MSMMRSPTAGKASESMTPASESKPTHRLRQLARVGINSDKLRD